MEDQMSNLKTTFPKTRAEYQKEWRKKNPDKHRIYKKRYFELHPREKKVRVFKNSTSKEYRREQSKIYRTLKAEYIKKIKKEWKLKNPEKLRQYSRKRKALKRNLMENYKVADERFTRQLFSNMCARCNRFNDLVIDHHYPLSLGHILERDNAVLLCKICNGNKNNKLPDEFYTKQELDRIEYILAIGNKA